MNALSDASIIEKIKSLGWKQGSLLNLKEGRDDIKLKSGLYIVISQDCDLIHRCFESEPNVEVLFLSPIVKQEGNYRHGGNPRRLHLALISNNDLSKQHYYECLMAQRAFFDRKVLAQIEPDNHFSLPPIFTV